MASALALAALPVGLVLITVSVGAAALYAPFTKSRTDTAIIAFTGVRFQLGCLVATSSAVLFVFGMSGIAGFEMPLFTEAVLAELASHLTLALTVSGVGRRGAVRPPNARQVGRASDTKYLLPTLEQGGRPRRTAADGG